MKNKYYLRDLENGGTIKEITLKQMENDRNNTEPPEPYSIKCYEDVIAADMKEFYAEIGYELVVEKKRNTCGECKHYVSESKRCNMRKIFYNIQPTDTGCCCFEVKTPPTNGDRIRQMSNEELASKFGYPCPPIPQKHCSGISNEECTECWLKWLNAPAKEGEDE